MAKQTSGESDGAKREREIHELEKQFGGMAYEKPEDRASLRELCDRADEAYEERHADPRGFAAADIVYRIAGAGAWRAALAVDPKTVSWYCHPAIEFILEADESAGGNLRSVTHEALGRRGVPKREFAEFCRHMSASRGECGDGPDAYFACLADILEAYADMEEAETADMEEEAETPSQPMRDNDGVARAGNEWGVGRRSGWVSADAARRIGPGDLIGVWTAGTILDGKLPHPAKGRRLAFAKWGEQTPCLMLVLYRGAGWLDCVPFGMTQVRIKDQLATSFGWSEGIVFRVPTDSPGVIACVGYDDAALLAAAESDMPRFRDAFAKWILGTGATNGRSGIKDRFVERALLAVGLPAGEQWETEAGRDAIFSSICSLYGVSDIDGLIRIQRESAILAVREAGTLEAQWSQPPAERDLNKVR